MHVKILIHVHWCVFKGCWRPSVHCSPKRHFFVNMPSWNSEEETEANCVQHVSMRLNKGHYQKCKNLIFSLYSRVVRQNLNNADHYNIKGSHYPKNVTNCTFFLFKLWQIQTSRCTLNILNILYLNHHWYKALQFSRILEDELDVKLQNGKMHSAPCQRWPNPPVEAQVEAKFKQFWQDFVHSA